MFLTVNASKIYCNVRWNFEETPIISVWNGVLKLWQTLPEGFKDLFACCKLHRYIKNEQ
jgi:hypothetical protein